MSDAYRDHEGAWPRCLEPLGEGECYEVRWVRDGDIAPGWTDLGDHPVYYSTLIGRRIQMHDWHETPIRHSGGCVMRTLPAHGPRLVRRYVVAPDDTMSPWYEGDTAEARCLEWAMAWFDGKLERTMAQIAAEVVK